MTILTTKSETLAIKSDEDVGRVRQLVRQYAVDLKFSIVEQTKIVTAASELARNIMVHGGGQGSVRLEVVSMESRNGLRLTFEDDGPGIPDIDRALTDGYTTGTGLGLGLSGSKRLVNDFEIHSEAGRGTRVIITRWK